MRVIAQVSATLATAVSCSRSVLHTRPNNEFTRPRTRGLRCASTQSHGPRSPLRSRGSTPSHQHHSRSRCIPTKPAQPLPNRLCVSSKPPSTECAHRRRSLQDALDRVAAFRQLCEAQQQLSQSPQIFSSSPSSAQRALSGKAVVAATLADVASANRDAAQPPVSSAWTGAAQPFAAPSSSSPAPIPPMERQLLTYYAGLLHAVRQAAVRVSTSDFNAFYASAVAAALAPSTPSTKAAPTNPFRIPRSPTWEDEKAARGTEAACRRDGVAQAEQRLGYWAAQWHDEVLQRHSCSTKPRLSSASGNVEHAGGNHPRKDLNNKEGKADDADEQSIAQLLLQGDWRQALRLLTPQSVETFFSPAALRHRRRVWLRPSRTATAAFPRLPRHLATAPVTPVELRLLQSPPVEGLRVLARVGERWRRATVLERGEDPRDTDIVEVLRVAAVQEAAQGRACGVPPSCVVRLRRRLWILQNLPCSLPPSLVHFEEKKCSRGASSVKAGVQLPHSASMPHAYLRRCEALEKLPWYPLCVLGHVFEITAEASDTRVDGLRKAERIAEVLGAAREHLREALLYSPEDYASVFDYLHLVFVSLGSTMAAHQVAALIKRRGGGREGGSHAHAAAPLVEKAFADTAIALFQPPDPEVYAAATTSAAAAAPGAVASQDPSVKRETQNADQAAATFATWSSLVGRVEEAERSVRAAADVPTDLEVPTSPSRSDSTDITTVRRVSARTLHQLRAAAQTWSNYHRSLYCETLSQICDGPGVALREMSRVLRGANKTHCEERDAQQEAEVEMVVLAPESAAAVTTAVLLQRLAHPARESRPPSALREGPCQASSDGYPDLLFFVVPHDKAFAVASYFKGIFHPSLFQRVCLDESPDEAGTSAGAVVAQSATSTPSSPTLKLASAEWERNALARLVGRSLRRVDRYPTRTTEAFFARHIRGDERTTRKASLQPDAPPAFDYSHGEVESQGRRDDSRASYAPPLAVDLYTVDLRAAAAHWRCRLHSAPDASPSSVGDEVERSIAEEGGTKRAQARQDDGARHAGKDALVLVAAPPQLPYGLHAVFKPAHVSCTLHAHYTSLVYPFLSRDLPWRSDNLSLRDHPSRAEPAEANLVVPSMRQQGLVNRIDVGTSGVVLVARDSTSLQCATDAMVRQHHMRKTYRALVQRWPPFTPQPLHFRSTSDNVCSDRGANHGTGEPDSGTPLFTNPPFLSSLPSATVCAPVYAAGATASAIEHQRQQHRRQYSRPHAALHDTRPAITRYRVLEWFESAGVAYVQVDLDSGRRHQIRQHFALLGFPLVGDTRYHPGVMEGGVETRFGLQRAALHAYSIELLVTAEDVGDNGKPVEEPGRVVVQVPLPTDIHNALRTLRAQKEKRQRSPPARR
ncbi:RNA pseudouridylate synthase-like protein [Leptomonas seymouri]|uniref:RNA pseudouridylate synthase-like protein n=1 Tax=Leptomonas seymouri TaxID=5684 RepID=A0A0N1PBF4_LEPSE|nr:RNA pseudouridylate synthase-like protein [Leptomonas seymouri]|eukprot:KPI83462.1 RNA pseudouridylate synthase-like protein [Leptomonas seymouri]